MSRGDTEAALYRLLYLCPGGGGVAGVKAGGWSGQLGCGCDYVMRVVLAATIHYTDTSFTEVDISTTHAFALNLPKPTPRYNSFDKERNGQTANAIKPSSKD